MLTFFVVPLAVFGLLAALTATPLVVYNFEKKGDWK